MSFLSALDIAAELHVSRSYAYEIMRQMPRLAAGRAKRVSREDFDEWKLKGGADGWLTNYASLLLPKDPALWTQVPLGAPVVYFLGQRQHVKIGVTTDLRRRLSALRGSNPEPTELLAVLLGGIQLEKQLHKRFQAVRGSGEWFHRRGDLSKLIERLT